MRKNLPPISQRYRAPTEQDLQWVARRSTGLFMFIITLPMMAPLWLFGGLVHLARKPRRRLDVATGRYKVEPMYRHWFRRTIWR